MSNMEASWASLNVCLAHESSDFPPFLNEFFLSHFRVRTSSWFFLAEKLWPSAVKWWDEALKGLERGDNHSTCTGWLKKTPPWRHRCPSWECCELEKLRAGSWNEMSAIWVFIRKKSRMTLSTNFCQTPTSNLNSNSWVQIRFNGVFQCLFLPHRSPPSSFTVILQNIQPINQKQFVLNGANKRPVVKESF